MFFLREYYFKENLLLSHIFYETCLWFTTNRIITVTWGRDTTTHSVKLTWTSPCFLKYLFSGFYDPSAIFPSYSLHVTFPSEGILLV